jgi:hypothetical protein
MKKLLLLASVLLASSTQAQSCVENWLVVGQSNAGNIVKFGGLQGAVTSQGCTVKVFTSIRYATPIERFMTSEYLYTNTVRYIKSKKAKIDRIIFWQGEANTYEHNSALSWSSNAAYLIGSYVSKVGTSDNIPVTVFAINDIDHGNGRKYWRFIRQNQLAMRHGNITAIDSGKYQLKADNVHFEESAYVEMVGDLLK